MKIKDKIDLEVETLKRRGTDGGVPATHYTYYYIRAMDKAMGQKKFAITLNKFRCAMTL